MHALTTLARGDSSFIGSAAGKRLFGDRPALDRSKIYDVSVSPPWPWPTKLYRRRGARKRLLGITVYYDFRWLDLFKDGRTQFKNGLSLARLVQELRPPNKRPALLLTVDDTAEEGAIETDQEYVLVVRIRHYLASAVGDAAAAYYAQGLQRQIAQLEVLKAVADSPELVKRFLDDHLTIDLVRAWAVADPARTASLRDIAPVEDARTTVSAETIARTLRDLKEIPQEVWQALVNLVPSLLDDDARQALLDAITNDQRGRKAATATLGARIADRIADTREAIAKYERLVGDEASDETALQLFIQEHPWMVGLDYVSVRAKTLVPRGQLDFSLERFDGFYDILELKGPNEPIVLARETSDGLPPPASAYRLGPAVAQALAQVHVYRDLLSTEPELMGRLYGLKHSRDPRLIIVVGRAEAMTEDSRRVLEQLNLSLHRVEIMPYDLLGRRAEGWLANVERYLSDDQQ